MLNTIKSKIIFIAIALLLVLSVVLTSFSCINFKNDKELMIAGSDYAISSAAEKINKEISKLENNAIDLALMGEGYYITGRQKSVANYLVKRIFERYENSLGGGIWFEPYAVRPDKIRTCTYAYRSKNGNVVIDENFESEAYNYLNQSWYKEIKPKLSEDNIVAWSNPYHEKQGSGALMTTVGAGIYNGNKLVGISTVDWEINSIINTVSKLPSTKNSFVLFADKNNDYILVSTDKYLLNENLLGHSLKAIPWYSEKIQNEEVFVYHGVRYISYVKTLDNGMILIINVPESELFEHLYKHMALMLIMLFLASVLIANSLYIVLKKNINKPIEELTSVAKKIGQGDFDIGINLSKPQEFADLANTFNKMASDIKNYIKHINTVVKEKERMESELSIARTIQYSALPHTFYPTMKEFEIFATMDSAKEVGGDFYDFFFINPKQFMFLVADVSGKGIPAALFMMTTKTLIKNLANENYSPDELINKINSQICENNSQGMFVTLFACIIDITTGKMTYLNCGHNPPLIKKSNQQYEFLRINSNLVLGAMEDVKYSVFDAVLQPGDTLFMYTDGLTEALNINEDLYGESRLQQCLNSEHPDNVQGILEYVKQDVKNFVGLKEQSDDLTMLAFKYKGCSDADDIKKIVIPAKKENYPQFIEWLKNICSEANITENNIMKIELVSEELFLNVSDYAYNEGTGNLEVSFDKNNAEIVMQFIDSGIQYNPLEKEEPDISLNAEQRPIGGLGIFMVKQSVDDISYEYKDGKNILTLKFKLK